MVKLVHYYMPLSPPLWISAPLFLANQIGVMYCVECQNVDLQYYMSQA